MTFFWFSFLYPGPGYIGARDGWRGEVIDRDGDWDGDSPCLFCLMDMKIIGRKNLYLYLF